MSPLAKIGDPRFTNLAVRTKVKNTRCEADYRRVTFALLLSLLVLSCFFINSCARQGTGGVGGQQAARAEDPGGGDDFFLKEIVAKNVQFAVPIYAQGVQQQQHLHSARAFWIRANDSIYPSWETFEMHWEREGKMCAFPDSSSTEDCQVCEFCVVQRERRDTSGRPCLGAVPVFQGGPNLVADPGFIETDVPVNIDSFAGIADKVLGTCAMQHVPADYPHPFFQPQMDGLYRFQSTPGLFFRGDTDGMLKVFVVQPAASMFQKAAYQLGHEVIDNTDYWTWKIMGDPLWEENFSSNLSITNVRILKGRCSLDPASGRECSVPNEGVPVKPSRLLFLSFQPGQAVSVMNHQQEAMHRCYSSIGTSDDGFINMRECHGTYGPGSTVTAKEVVPTYEIGQPEDRLTWFIEFNINEGADADLTTPANDPLQAGESLIIQFTIQAN
jgi:hypothetical protein